MNTETTSTPSKLATQPRYTMLAVRTSEDRAAAKIAALLQLRQQIARKAN